MATRIVEQTVCTCEKVTDVTEVPDAPAEESSGGSLLGTLVLGTLAVVALAALSGGGDSVTGVPITT